ncbi:MAG: GAF domain-containing protein, partial [Anaerolineales bacterium]
MTPAPRSPRSSDWRDIASLGEQIVNADSLAEQRDRIIDIASRLISGEIDVWLCEKVFRLPNLNEENVFPEEPDQQGMQRAIKAGQVLTKQRRAKSTKGKSTFTPRETWAAVPIIEQEILLGALQVTRNQGPEFKQAELDLLERLAGAVAVNLIASHRVAVERFRLNQLNLVREVSAQIANVLNVEELASRVTELIQETFHFYYVAIFTLQDGSTSLRFRSSAMPKGSRSRDSARREKRNSPVGVDVELGQGLIGQSAATGERILVNDVKKDTRYRSIDSLPETRSEVALPLKIGERVLGVLDVQSDQPDSFHPNDLLILGSLSDTIARAVEGARLYNDLRRRADQLALVAEVSKSVSASLELKTLMSNVATLIHDRFGYLYVHLFSVHRNRRLIQYEAGSGTRSKDLVGYTLSLDDPQGIIPWVAREGQTVLANDAKGDERYRPSPFPPEDTNSELCVPLRYREEIVGILDIQSDKRNAFTQDDHLIFEAVADNIATAIHNADLYRSERWRRQVADGIREVAGLISADAGVDDVFEAILSELDRNLPVDISAIWLLEDDELYLAACHNCDEASLEQALYDAPDAYERLMNALYAEEPVIRKTSDPIWVTGLTAGFEQDYSG